MFRKNGLPPLQLNKQNVRGTLMAYLALLLVATLMFTGISYARYTASARGTASASVAAFAVTVTSPTTTNININSNVTPDNAESAYLGSTSFTVSNKSGNRINQVTTSYKVVVVLPTALAKEIKMTLDNNNATSISGNTYTFSNSSMKFQPGVSKTNTHKLTFNAYDYKVNTTQKITLNGIKISVVADQVD